jgi:3-deoxy-manno-octulosonate cytidylyltransferase (CMP-KDO synthetase)
MKPPLPDVAVLIPARWESSRLPGKMLIPILGKPLIQWVYEIAAQTFGRERVYILTDHENIANAARSFGVDSHLVMTPKDCISGSARLSWALQNPLRFLQAQWIIGWQGDEPLLPIEAVFTCLEALKKNPQAALGTLCCPLSEEDFENPSAVKCVSDRHGRALYFSRSPIPNPGWHKNRTSMPKAAKRHVGLYIWSRKFLVDEFQKLQPSPLQLAEDLEQLGILEEGYMIQTAFWPGQMPPGVDVASDVKLVSRRLSAQ